MASWNPWHGCAKYSEGCENCYVYRMDERHGKDGSVVQKTKQFQYPVSKKRDGSYRLEEVTVGGESGNNARICNFSWVLSLCDDVKKTGFRSHSSKRGPGFKGRQALFDCDQAPT